MAAMLFSSGEANGCDSALRHPRLEEFRMNINDNSKLVTHTLAHQQTFTTTLSAKIDSAAHALDVGRTCAATPKAWLLKQLQAGYYGAPANFVSWQDRQAEEKVRSRALQAERRRQVRMQGLQADFELWLDALGTAERQAILRPPVTSNSSSLHRP